MMNTMRRFILPFAMVFAIGTGIAACTSLASFTAGIATEVSSSTPQQVSTLAQALSVATIITRAADVYVQVGQPDRATTLKIRELNNSLHSALTKLEADQAAGKSLVYDAFNEALKAFNSYATVKGIPH